MRLEMMAHKQIQLISVKKWRLLHEEPRKE